MGGAGGSDEGGNDRPGLAAGAAPRALQLDEAERTHLFDLARAADANPSTRRRTGSHRVRPRVQRILDLVIGPAAHRVTVRLLPARTDT